MKVHFIIWFQRGNNHELILGSGFLIKLFIVSTTAGRSRLYLQRLKTGSEDARNKLIEHNLRLVAHVVRKYENSGEDREDLISTGTIGLINPIKTFNEGRGVRLATYAARCVENEVFITAMGGNKREI